MCPAYGELHLHLVRKGEGRGDEACDVCRVRCSDVGWV